MPRTTDLKPPPVVHPRRAKTPTVLQMEAVECGAASLSMILGYYGAWVPLEELRVACGVTRDGSKASNLLKAARRYGLSAKGFKKEPADLASLPVPSIIHWNFNHYLVFEGCKGGKVYLNDPASGPRIVSEAELDASYTGVVLAFEPTEAFQKRGRKPSAFKAIRARLSGSETGLGFVILASLLMVIPGIAIAGFAKIFVDSILIAEDEDWLVPLVLCVLTVALFQGVLTWLQQKYLLRLEARLALSMASRFLWRLVRLPIAFFQQRHVGDLSDRMAANDRVAALVSGQFATNVMNLTTVVFYGAAIAAFDLLLGGIAVAMAGVNVLALKAVNRSREDNSRALLSEGGKLMGVTMASIRSAETLKASGMEDDSFSKWAGYQAKMLERQRKLGLSSAVLTAFPALMSSLTTAAILSVGGFRVMDGALSIGAIVAIQTLMTKFNKPITGLVDLGGQIQRIKGDFARLDDIAAYPLEPPRGPKDGETWTGPAILSGKLQMRDISFGYSALEPPLLDGVTIDITPGARVALVGESGSGKSTLGRLIVGTLNPWQGEILFDGIPANDVPSAVFADTVSYVDQDIFLFAGTVRDNLALWTDTIPETSLTRALKDALVHDDVMARSGRLDSWVGEGGVNFSGGQRQRLEIARALVSEPRILVLDEATAALDPVMEKQIDDNLRRRGCTCVIIAHRLSTIRDCDEIIVLKRGRIVERGAHDDLMAANGEYRRLIGSEG